MSMSLLDGNTYLDRKKINVVDYIDENTICYDGQFDFNDYLLDNKHLYMIQKILV